MATGWQALAVPERLATGWPDAYVMAMTAASHSLLPARGLLAANGEDARKLLQGLISNDIELVSPEREIGRAHV